MSDTPPNTPEARRASAIVTIDSAAIAANWRLIKDKTLVETAAVIKANGYGVGADVAGPALHKEGCEVFFVATIDEGITLRAVLGSGPEIHILSGFMDGCERDLTANALTPILNSLDDVEAWGVYCRASETAHPATLHIDTGMSRLGLGSDEVTRVAATPNLLAGLNLATVMSHLAVSEEPDNPKNTEQLARFQSVLAELSAQLSGLRTSLANSSGVFLGPEYAFDMVRPGAALFGINPIPNSPDKPNPMRQVVRLQAKILQVRQIDSPQTVGYGATHQARCLSKIATIAAGYADGFNRSLSNRGVAFIGEHRAPFVGRVSMDLITIDVTDVPEALAHAGALVDLIGPNNPVDDVAARGETIAYEMLTRLGPRYHRVIL